MKKLVLISTLLTSSSFASLNKARMHYMSKDQDKNLKVFKELFESKFYLTSATYLRDYLKEGNDIPAELDDYIDTVVIKSGIEVFDSISTKRLREQKNWSLKFIAATRDLKKAKYTVARDTLQSYPKEHKFAPEAFLIRATSYTALKDFKMANRDYNRCSFTAKKLTKSADNDKLKRYYTIVGEKCLLHKARNYFRVKNYKKAIKIYQEIPKTSYTWPYTLMEMAWSHYYLEDYNRVLGLLVTYKSPLLESYFFPEAEYLSALSYHNMCLYNDSQIVVDKYDSFYRPKVSALKEVILANKKSDTYFLKLALKDMKEVEKINPYMRNLVTQVKKRIRYSLDLINLKRGLLEQRTLKKIKKDPFTEDMDRRVSGVINWKRRKLNHFVKKEMYSFVNEIHRFSYELFNVSLENISKQKDLIYKGRELANNRARGDISHVKRDELQLFWTFKGAFWADEIGDYSFGLKSNCKSQKQGSKS